MGAFGYIGSLGLTAWAFFTQHYTIVPACIFAFITSHAVGQGAVIWVFISEIFPNRHRAESHILGSSTHWTCAALLTTFFPQDGFDVCARLRFPVLPRHDGAGTDLDKTMIPETKGVPLEQMQDKLGITLLDETEVISLNEISNGTGAK